MLYHGSQASSPSRLALPTTVITLPYLTKKSNLPKLSYPQTKRVSLKSSPGYQQPETVSPGLRRQQAADKLRCL